MKNLSSILKPAATLVALLLVGSAAAHAVTITQSPFGDYWHPISPDGGTYVYANSFTSPVNGDVTELGTWLNTEIEDASTMLRFQVLGSLNDDALQGPDVSKIFATTVDIGGFSGSLSFYSGSAQGGGTGLLSGETYWFAISAVGSAGIGVYQVGGADDDLGDGGSFWYSNDSSGTRFDGENLSPEMAFSVTFDGVQAVPEGGATALMLGSALMGLAAAKRKLQSL